MPDPTSGAEEFVLESELDVLERVDRDTIKYSSLAGFDDAQAEMIAMAIIEAVTNAVVHGNKFDGEKSVGIRYEWKPGLLTVTVNDDGEGFDLSCVLDPTDPERCLESSGRGIYIMREIMDSVDFDISAKRGTTVTLKKAA